MDVFTVFSREAGGTGTPIPLPVLLQGEAGAETSITLCTGIVIYWGTDWVSFNTITTISLSLPVNFFSDSKNIYVGWKNKNA